VGVQEQNEERVAAGWTKKPCLLDKSS